MSDLSPIPSFADLGLDAELLSQTTRLGYTTPTPIQAAAIPVLLAGRDVLGQAATGTGKTAAFGLPLLAAARQPGAPGARRAIEALVLVPTRELAVQVSTAITGMARGGKLRVVPVFGGESMSKQLGALRLGADIVVATPGRLLDHIRRGSIKCDQIVRLVLDEADEMLDMGFADDLEAIFATLPKERQTALFSATMPRRVADIARRHLKQPEHIAIARPEAGSEGDKKVQQWAHGVKHMHKAPALLRVLACETPVSCIVFCRTRRDVDALLEAMRQRRFKAAGLHGGMAQNERDRVMKAFRDGHVSTLIATDVAARGLDIDHVSHVINFDLPESPETYVHRIGRTGRAGRSGVAISFVEPAQERALGMFRRKVQHDIPLMALPKGEAVQAKRMGHAMEKAAAAAQGTPAAHMTPHICRLLADHTPEQLAQMALQLAVQGDSSTDDLSDIPCFLGRDALQKRPNKGDAVNQARSTRGNWKLAQLYVGAGRQEGVNARDLVHFIADTVNFDPRSIGHVHIATKFSLVEVPATAIDEIIAKMGSTKFGGKSIEVRQDHGQPKR